MPHHLQAVTVIQLNLQESSTDICHDAAPPTWTRAEVLPVQFYISPCVNMWVGWFLYAIHLNPMKRKRGFIFKSKYRGFTSTEPTVLGCTHWLSASFCKLRKGSIAQAGTRAAWFDSSSFVIGRTTIVIKHLNSWGRLLHWAVYQPSCRHPVKPQGQQDMNLTYLLWRACQFQSLGYDHRF